MEKKMAELTEDELDMVTGGGIEDLLQQIKNLNNNDHLCLFCGYSEEGMSAGSNCPRCGQPIML